MKVKMLFVMTTAVFLLTADVFAQNDTASVNIDEVIISAGRIEQTVQKIHASVEIIDSKQINNSVSNSVDDVLKNYAGLNITRSMGIYGKSCVSMRGLGGNEQGRILVLQDGVPINTSDLGSVNWNRINPFTVSKIEIFRGPASFVYGSNAMGGIINLVTKNNSDKIFYAKAKIAYGTYNTFSADMALSGNPLKSKKWTYNFNAFYRISDGYINKPDSLRDSTHVASWSEEYGVNLTNSYKINESNTFDLSYNFYDDRRGQGVKIYDATGNSADHDTHFLRAKYKGKSGKLTWNTNLYFQNEHYLRIVEKLKNSYSMYHVSSLRNDLGIFADLSYKTKKNTFSAGLDFKKGSVKGADEYQTSTDIIRNIGAVNNFSAFLFEDIELFKHVSLNAAVHYDHVVLNKSEFILENITENSEILIPFQFDISGKSWSAFSPKFSLQFSNGKIKSYVSYSAGFRAPTLDDLTRSGFISGAFKIANPELEAEKINSFEFGSTVNIKKIKFDFTAYYSLGNDFMYYTETGEFIFGSKPIVKKENITKVELFGLESSLNVYLNENFRAFANYTYGRNRITSFVNNEVLEGKSLTFSPDHMINFGFSLNSKIVDFTGTLKYMTEQYTDDANTVITDEQILLDLKLMKRFQFGMEISVSAQNLLDNRYLIYYDQVSIGRFITVGLSYNFNK